MVALPSVEYTPRDPGGSVLQQVVREHFETFLAEAAQLRDGEGLPRFVEEEFEAYLRCGWLAGGFARFRCGCGLDRLVAFSCKGRGFCASCGGRRMTERAAHLNDDEVMRRAQEVATSLNLPLMIHMGQTRSPLPKLFDRLKPGDVVTHMFARPPSSIVDDNGRILPEVLAARRRGGWFDVGNGQTGHMRWDIIERIMKAGFWPDTFSSDWNVNSPTTGVIDFPNCMSKLFGYGMTVPQAIACATLNASRTFEVFRDRGTLNVGAVADVALLELREGNFEFLDNFNNKVPGRQRLFPAGTVLAGKRIPRI